MANIKISELNELEEVHDNDLLVVVDDSENETKKAKAKSLTLRNEELIAVTDIEPEEFSEGDKYYNTTDNKIYTAVATDTWSQDGDTPIEGKLYIVFNEQSTYAYNGTTLVSVGGGSGSSDIVVVPTETPTEETKLEIEDEDFDFNGSEITDEYSESTKVGYSANYSNEHFGGIVLYDNSTGSTNTITLSDNASNYKFIDIMFQGNNGTTDTTRAYDLTKGINLFTANVNPGVTNAWLQFETISFSGNTINRGAQGEMAFNSNGFIELVSSSLKITKVIGYK